MRQQIRDEVNSICPLDDLERNNQSEVLAWIDSGAPLCRVQKPAIPPKHLISYFVLLDGDHLLLVDHINAQLWLPTGGHVEEGEHPRTTVAREVVEELGIQAQFLEDSPFFLTVTETVGLTAGHIDVSLWYLLKGNQQAKLKFDESEFYGVHWFHKHDVPLNKTDAQMQRFLTKLAQKTT